MLTRLVKSVDIYGKSFSLTIDGSSSRTTSAGGFLTLITLGIAIVCLFLFGQDLINKKNPRVLTSTTFPTVNSTYYNFSEENFPIYFNFFHDLTGQFVDISEYLYINIVYMNFTRNESIPNVLDQYNQDRILLNPIKCDQMPEIKERSGINKQDFYCVKYPKGNKWMMADNILIYPVIDIQFSLCNNDYTKCKDFEKAKKFFSKNKIIFSLAKMNAKFYPLNANQPLKDTVTFQYYAINYNFHRAEAQYMSFLELDDDQGILFQTSNKTSSFESSQVDYSYHLVEDEDVPNNPVLYSVSFSINYSYKSLSRSYMKIPELIAQVSGFIEIVRIIFSIVTSKLCDIDYFNFLFNYLFTNSGDKE
jgi:hypothetical protein